MVLAGATMFRNTIGAGLFAALAICAGAHAQDLTPGTAETRRIIPEGAVVVVEIGQTIDSKIAKRGDQFPLRLSEPLVIDEQVVLPAGAAGVGEVIHASPSKGGGKAGELLLAARSIESGDLKILLRALKVGGQGDDQTLATLVLSTGIGPLAMFVRGAEIVIPSGTRATAKVARATELPFVVNSEGSPE